MSKQIDRLSFTREYRRRQTLVAVRVSGVGRRPRRKGLGAGAQGWGWDPPPESRVGV